MTAVFTDALTNHIGLVDISASSDPQGLGRFSFGAGKPTGVALKGKYALVTVETGTVSTTVPPVLPSGYLAVVDISNPTNPTLKRSIDLGGQPDSMFVSPDKKYAIAVIENRRTNDGLYPQNPTIPGFIAIFDISAENPESWIQKPNVALTKLPGLRFEDDPEPEYASINDDNIAAVTLQENNAIVFINITNGQVIQSIHAGSVNLDNVDLKDDKEILQSDTQVLRRREPDGLVSFLYKFAIFSYELFRLPNIAISRLCHRLGLVNAILLPQTKVTWMEVSTCLCTILLCVRQTLSVSSLTFFFRDNSHPLSTGSRGFSIFDAGKSSGHSHEVCFQSYCDFNFSFLLSISEW